MFNIKDMLSKIRRKKPNIKEEKEAVTEKKITTTGTALASLPTVNVQHYPTGGITSNLTAAAGNVGINGPYYGNIMTANVGAASTIYGAIPGNYGVIGITQQPSVVAFHGTSNQEIVRLERDGSVKWSNGIQIDEAAEAFGNAIKLGSEISVGITARVKREMRDTVFEELISISKEKGSLSAEDLTYLWEATKIMDKLKGAKE